MDQVKVLVEWEFDMKDLGEMWYFLDIEMICTKDGIGMLQRKHELDMLSKYGMPYYKPTSMPLDQNLKLSASECEVLENPTMYKKIICSLIYMTH